MIKDKMINEIPADMKLCYERVMECEFNLESNPKTWDQRILSADFIFHEMQQIMAYVQLGALPRSFYSKHYGLESIEYVPESVGAHTLAMAVFDLKALIFQYGENFEKTKDGYTLFDAILNDFRHDIAENVTKDIADNGERNEVEKNKIENRLQKQFDNTHPKINQLFNGMHTKTIPTSVGAHVRDKGAGILRTLHEQEIVQELKNTLRNERNTRKIERIEAKIAELEKHIYPRMDRNYPKVSKLDKMAMHICDYCENGKYRASEMWTIRYFKTSNTILFDETGYATAIIIAATLNTNHRWYNWRANDYL